ncbi:MAG: sigma 54-interacting transcriptional regulator [Acidobacteriota bacterium]|nr:sigma 54-interacting transcriptional regulator [Acidobacteriota bacterium]
MTQDEPTTMMPEGESSDGDRRIPVLTIICHPNLQRIGDYLVLYGAESGRGREISRTTPDFHAPSHALGKPLLDSFLSRTPFLLMPGDAGGIRLIVGQCRSEIRCHGERVSDSCYFSSRELEEGVVISLARRIVLFLRLVVDKEDSILPDYGMVGCSSEMRILREEIAKVADLKTPVLLRGESGTGKELVARAVHKASGAGGTFVPVNMGAIPQNLAASELFGAVKGSFTGADRNQLGFFKQADGGTLFLDEIGEASAEVQVLLLRALENGVISPVGSQQSIPFSARLIAATDADLDARMEEDSFKAPLFHRLAGYEISLPPLRKRMEDFGRLFMFFAKKELPPTDLFKQTSDPKAAAWLPADLVEKLMAFHWPGNVRQLSNVVRQLVIGCRGRPTLSMVPKVAELLEKVLPQPTGLKEEPKKKPAEIGEGTLIDTLRNNAWELKATAASFGISRGALYQLISKYPNVRKAGDLSREEIERALVETEGDDVAAAALLEVSLRAFRRRATDLGIV